MINKSNFIIFNCIAVFLVLNCYAQQNSENNLLHQYFDGKFGLQVFAGYSSLKALPDFFIEDEFPELPRILMDTYGVRFGKMNHSKISTSTFWELSFGSSNGRLKLQYAESGTTHKVKVSNTILGGAYGIWIPLYARLNSTSFSLAPKALLLNLKLGIDVMILREEQDETNLSISPEDEGAFIVYQPSPNNETIQTGDWVLFSFGVGIDYVISKYALLRLEGIIGTYPVSGPGNSEGEPTGPPDTWGSNRMLLLGLQLLL